MAGTTELTEMVDPVTGEIERLLAQGREQGASLVGPGGLLGQLTKNVLETVLESELTEHLGHERGQTPLGSNVRNGTSSKTVLTEIGPVWIVASIRSCSEQHRDGSTTNWGHLRRELRRKL